MSGRRAASESEAKSAAAEPKIKTKANRSTIPTAYPRRVKEKAQGEWERDKYESEAGSSKKRLTSLDCAEHANRRTKGAMNGGYIRSVLT